MSIIDKRNRENPLRELCCWPDCGRTVYFPARMCQEHAVRIYLVIKAQIDQDGPELVLGQWITGGSHEHRGPRPEPVDSWVYYLRVRDGDIKIGFSSSIKKRLTQLRARHGDLLAIEPGGRHLESLRHSEFAAIRRAVNIEDFAPTPDLLSHIEMLVSHFGEPYALLA